jgi:DnaJ-class molecular chaperone
MPNYDIRVRVAAKKSPRPLNYCEWKCPFCHGEGLNPYGKTSGDRCPACHGRMFWEADADCGNLSGCGRCAGSGRVNYMGSWAPCGTCRGSGKV